MPLNSITGTPDNFKLVSKTKPVPLLIKGTLLFIALLIFLTPFAVIIFTGFNPGMILGIAISSFISFRLLRIVLWNAYGVEIITYKDGILKQECDFKYFKSTPVEHTGKLLSVTFPGDVTHDSTSAQLLDDHESVQSLSVIIFLLENKTVESTLPVNKKHTKDFFQVND